MGGRRGRAPNHGSHGRLGLRLVTALAGVLAMVLAVGPAATAAGQGSPREQLVVMTRNLYLGSSLTPALTATDPASFLGAVATIYGTSRFTNFPARAEAVADEIATERPHLVGLQEVTRWETSGPGVPPTEDFLEILQAALAARGLDYTVAAVADNADIGPLPLVQPCAVPVVGACLVTLKDRDVILVDADRDGLTWGNPCSGSYQAQAVFSPPVPGAEPVSFARGWTSIDGRFHNVPFHFANTHLEIEQFAAVQEAQAAEFLAGPAQGRGADIAVGDFNSAADGSTTSSYAQLTSSFRDAWWVNGDDPGLTCCQNSTLTNPTSQLGSRIDLVLARQGARAVSAEVVGDVPFSSLPPLWASDHAGVVATLRLGG
jgi:hypothetical protein